MSNGTRSVPYNPDRDSDGTDEDDGCLSCYEWTRGTDSASPGVDYWSHYPGAAEQYDTHEVCIVFWPDPTTDPDA